MGGQSLPGRQAGTHIHSGYPADQPITGFEDLSDLGFCGLESGVSAVACRVQVHKASFRSAGVVAIYEKSCPVRAELYGPELESSSAVQGF